MGVELTALHRKKICYEYLKTASDLDGVLEKKRPKRQNIDMKFGLWKVRSLYRAGIPEDSFEGTSQI
jgi:hypothetical protein